MSNDGVIESRTFNLPFENIDTDQIIPAQFLTTTQREGLGQHCFLHWRKNPDGTEKADNPFASHDPEQHQILVAGANFGCGSSREHAPWGLLDMGFRVVISSRFADIFRNNSLKNGLLPLEAKQPVIDFLMERPNHSVRVNLLTQEVNIEGFEAFHFSLDPFSAYCMAHGLDQLDYILQHESEIAQHEQAAHA
jgi:3-isopropylmalate/(R)-2-methylmalate dehydratase small subunit